MSVDSAPRLAEKTEKVALTREVKTERKLTPAAFRERLVFGIVVATLGAVFLFNTLIAHPAKLDREFGGSHSPNMGSAMFLLATFVAGVTLALLAWQRRPTE